MTKKELLELNRILSKISGAQDILDYCYKDYGVSDAKEASKTLDSVMSDIRKLMK